MRLFTFYVPMIFAAHMMYEALHLDGPAYRAFTPGWDKPLREACSANKNICLKLEIEDDKRGYGNPKQLIVFTPPGKEQAGTRMMNSLISPTLRPGVTVYYRKEP